MPTRSVRVVLAAITLSMWASVIAAQQPVVDNRVASASDSRWTCLVSMTLTLLKLLHWAYVPLHHAPRRRLSL
jgi:hypothetical protein